MFPKNWEKIENIENKKWTPILLISDNATITRKPNNDVNRIWLNRIEFPQSSLKENKKPKQNLKIGLYISSNSY